MKEIVLIEAPSNLGLKEPEPGMEPGVKFFPSAMEKAGFASLAGIKQKIIIDAPAYSTEIDAGTKVRNTDKIITYSRQLADVLADVIKKKDIPVVIGGDCSILIGAALALKRTGNFGLFYLDGHTDYVLPEQSGTGGAAGMDLAIIAGKGHSKLTDIENRKPYLVEDNIFCCGNREFSEDWYVKAIAESDIFYYDLYRFRKEGLINTVNEFLRMIISKKLDGFWIHIDVDVLNDEIMPCVDSRQEDGLSYEELQEILYPLVHSENFCGINITIFDPTLDYEGIYGKQLAKQLADIFRPLQKN